MQILETTLSHDFLIKLARRAAVHALGIDPVPVRDRRHETTEARRMIVGLLASPPLAFSHRKVGTLLKLDRSTVSHHLSIHNNYVVCDAPYYVKWKRLVGKFNELIREHDA
jgi:hypothetical protein